MKFSIIGTGKGAERTDTQEISSGIDHVTKRRAFGQRLTEVLYSPIGYIRKHKKEAVLLGGAAAVLAGGYDFVATSPRTVDAYQQKWERRIDSLKGVVAPWFTDGSIGNNGVVDNNQNPIVIPPVIDLSTATPISTFTPTPTIVPTPTPDIVNFPIIVECPEPACTPEELAYYNRRFREEFDYLTNLFGIKPDKQIKFESEDGEQFLFHGLRYGFDWGAGVGKVQIDSPDNGIRHELMHTLLQTHVRWYDESIAKLAAHFDSYVKGEDIFGGAYLYDQLKRDGKPLKESPYTKASVFAGALRKYFSKDGEDFKNKVRQSTQELYDIALSDGTVSENKIFDIHSKYFGNLTELKEVMSYLLTE